MIPKYKKFIECLVPGTVCNFKCHYCYVAQLSGTENRSTAKFLYPAEIVGYALRQSRIGGVAYVNICGVGETLLPKEIPEIVEAILKEGHFVNIYTNGTITKAINKLCDLDEELRRRLCFSFSLHWIELKRTGMLNTYFENARKVRSAGCSFVSNIVLDDEYLPFVDEIKFRCQKELGAFPQASFPKKANRGGNYSSLSKNEEKLIEIAESFDSPYFRFTQQFYNYNRKKFCYAGAWSFNLNLATGDVYKCYGGRRIQNIFKNLDTPIVNKPVGTHCPCNACGGGLLLPMGLVPELKVPSYCGVKDRPLAKWYNSEFREFLSQQLNEGNEQLCGVNKIWIDFSEYAKELACKILRFSVQVLRRFLKNRKR